MPTASISPSRAQAGLAATWLRDLSDGYRSFRHGNRPAASPGRSSLSDEPAVGSHYQPPATPIRAATNLYFIGIATGRRPAPARRFTWQESDGPPCAKRRCTTPTGSLGAKMVPFAGWDMPVWYTSVVEEHLATRQAAGLFDVSHMGVYQAEGPDAVLFLDSVCGNDITALAVGESCLYPFS